MFYLLSDFAPWNVSALRMGTLVGSKSLLETAVVLAPGMVPGTY